MAGFVLSYIENKGTLFNIAPWNDYSNELRHRWACELEDLVHQIHTADLIWGDAKPQNILVDMNDRLWLIDFDGGYTPSWVERENEETRVGDWQVAQRIKEWLLECEERPLKRFVHVN